MNIALTGASGGIGKKLRSELLQSGHRINLLARTSIVCNKDQEKLIVGDLSNYKDLLNLVHEVDAVIHLAGLTHTNNVQKYYSVNNEGTKNLLRACKEKSVKRFIFISSRTASEHGGDYARSKLHAEEAVVLSQLDWIILRVAEVYGADSEKGVSQFVSLIKKSPIIPIIGNGHYSLAPVHIDDVVNLIIQAVESKISKKIYIVAGGEEFTYNEFIDKIAGIIKAKRYKLHIPVFLAQLVAWLVSISGSTAVVKDQIPRLLVPKKADIEDTKRDFDFNPRTITKNSLDI